MPRALPVIKIQREEHRNRTVWTCVPTTETLVLKKNRGKSVHVNIISNSFIYKTVITTIEENTWYLFCQNSKWFIPCQVREPTVNGTLRSSSDQPVIIFSINLGFLLSGVLESVKLQFLSQYAAEIRTNLQKRKMEARQCLNSVHLPYCYLVCLHCFN